MKLNNHGQTLIIFVILLPILLALMAFVVDISYMYNEKFHLENTTKMIIKNNYKNRLDNGIENKIKDLYKKNDIKINNLKIESTTNYLKIKNNYNIDSIFGKIVGLKKYKIKTNLKGYEEDNKIKVVEE